MMSLKRNQVWSWIRMGFCILAGAAMLLGQPASGLAKEGDLLLLCGAGLRQPVDEMIGVFEKETGIHVQVEYGGSGQLLTRYKATGQGDVFLPGSHFYVEQLKKEGEVVSSSPVALHTPVVAVNKASADKVKTFADLGAAGIRVGLGDPKAMALGRTADDILDHSGLKEQILKNVVVRAATVKQLTLYVVKGEVDAGIVGRADVVQNQDKLVMIDIDRSWYSPEIITVAVLKGSTQPEAASKLSQYLSSAQSIATFGRYGFLPVD